ALDPHLRERFLEERADVRGELGDREDASDRERGGRRRRRRLRLGFLEGEIEERAHRSAATGLDPAGRRSSSGAGELMPRLARARPVASSASITTPFSRGLPVAGSNRDGIPLRKRASAGSRSIPMIESCGPVMPTSVMYAVPFGSTRSSAVCTWVCVPK